MTENPATGTAGRVPETAAREARRDRGFRPGNVWTFAFVLLSLSLVVTVSPAIVLRHDISSETFEAFATDFPAAARILPDGAGALVSPRFILTAAHVARGSATRDPRVEIQGTEYGVERIFIHPDWKGRGAPDIALLQLESAVEGVTPVQLYEGNEELGMEVVFVGSGDTGNGLTGPKVMDRKPRAATNRVDAVDSDWIYFTFNAPSGGATRLEGVSGPGDSGGPALTPVEDQWVTIGVSVFSFDGKPGMYGTKEGYTRVAKHVEWIEAVLAGERDEEGFPPGDLRALRPFRR